MEKILEALKSKFEGVNAKQLEVKAKAMAKKGLTETDVESVTLESVIEAYADFRTNTASDKLKAEHAAAIEKLGGKGEQNQGNPKEGGTGSDGDDPNESAAVKEMRASMATMQATIAALQKSSEEEAKATLQSKRHSEIATMVSVIDESLRAPYLAGDFSAMDEAAFETHKATLQTSVDAAVKFTKGAGSSYQAPQGGGTGGKETATAADARRIMGLPPEEETK